MMEGAIEEKDRMDLIQGRKGHENKLRESIVGV
jgi:hypothetical protein